MGLLSTLGLKWIGFPNRRVQESITPDDDTGWLRATLSPTGLLTRDPDSLHGEALLRAAREAWESNPIARAIVEQITCFVLGGGATIVAEDPRVQRVIDSFWHDPDNNMPERIHSLQNELTLYGEQFIRLFIDPVTARTVIRQLDPLRVTHIETHPQDHEHPLHYLYDDLTIPATEVLHITINRLSASLRGRSDLAPVLPWLRIYSKWLKDRVTRNELANLLVWDVTLKGADLHQINAMRASHAHPPPTGSVLFHNDSETWTPINPQIHASDAAPDGRAIRLMVATGVMLPEHYLGEGGNANRATAAEMGLPAIKRFQRQQEIFRALLTRLVNRVLDAAVEVGRLGPRLNRSFTVQFEELTTSPLPDVAAAVKDLTTSLTLALENKLVTPEEARRLWWRYHAQADESAPQSSPSSAA